MNIDALITHPMFGSIWLSDVTIDEENVCGDAKEVLKGSHIPGGRATIKNTMTFSKNCVQKIKKYE